jgi:hypothetical protein
VVLFLAVSGGSYWYLNQNTNTGGYGSNLAGTIYNSPALSGNTILVPTDTVRSNKLVFIDIKLETSQQELVYKGRTIPLAAYRGGGYLPIVMIYTPQGNVLSGIRVCEPCGSFSFHIINGKLDCDKCHTQWDLDTLKGLSGGCQSYPPPLIPSTIGTNVITDLTSLGLKYI